MRQIAELIAVLACGLFTGAAVYVTAEIAPTRIRGRCLTLYQLGIVVGILTPCHGV